ncbi:MAG: SDR family oxidoreductase [Pseudomonadota bacterium]
MRNILITGCSSGIGYDAAATMRRRGWRVFAACRAEEDVARLKSEGFESLRIDYEDPASIETGLAEVLEATGGTLDALFNNGAYAVPGPVEDLPVDALRANFEANVFGWHDLTRRVIPVMREAGRGRIVQCSSVLGFVSLPWRGSYNATKYAVEALSDAMRVELRGTGIHVVLIEPGPIATEFGRNAIKEFERWIDWKSSARRAQYEASLLDRLYTEKPTPFRLPPSAVTAALVQALTSPRPRARYRVTTPTKLMAVAKRVLPTALLDRVIASA